MTEDQVIAALQAVADAGRLRRRRQALMWAGAALAVWAVTDLLDLLLPTDNLILFLTTAHRPLHDAVCAMLPAAHAIF